MRLFIAFMIPDDVSELLFDVQKNLVISGKATLTHSFHLTLKFLGDVDEDKLSILIDLLSKIEFRAFTAELAGIGVFPEYSDSRVVWVGLEPHDAISRLRTDVEKVCAEMGFDPVSRFHPHLTLARIKLLKDKQQFQHALESLKVPDAKFQFDSFKLIKSVLTPEGPKYDVLKSFPALPLSRM